MTYTADTTGAVIRAALADHGMSAYRASISAGMSRGALDNALRSDISARVTARWLSVITGEPYAVAVGQGWVVAMPDGVMLDGLVRVYACNAMKPPADAPIPPVR